MYIKQRHLDNLGTALAPGKAVVIYGARRTGKTTISAKPPKGWLETYPNATWQVSNRQNYLAMIT
jgi:hypothetical protein